MEQKMKARVLLLAAVLFLCTLTLAYSQETTSLAIPSVADFMYSMRIGQHVYYMPNNQLEFMGIDFSQKRKFLTDTYASLESPIANITYTHSPEGIYEVDNAMLLVQSHRGDLELKIPRFMFRPKATLEWSAMDLHKWGMVDVETPIKDKEGKDLLDKDGKPITEKSSVFAQNKDSIQRIYGGAGLAVEVPVTTALTFKTAGTYRFINQNGWEGSAGLTWMPGKLIKWEPHITLGVAGHESRYSWGSSRSLGILGEIGIVF
jgi:hypothetical protein